MLDPGGHRFLFGFVPVAGHDDSHLVAFAQPFDHVLNLGVEVVLRDSGAEREQFVPLDGRFRFAAFFLLPAFQILVEVFRAGHEFVNRPLRFQIQINYFNQLQVASLGNPLGLIQVHDLHGLILSDEGYFGGCFWLLGGRSCRQRFIVRGF
uniref:(northern house mosquito) hypothetical protein n=1 Tax=Culex pipiens TaxID=7175 RepID=A0A8D8HDV0_CULPI